jgi:hypothetical protein
MKRFWWLTVVLCLAGAVAFAQAEAKDASSEPEEGGAEWVPLFDGETLDGWEQHSGEAKYHVEDGAIVGTSVPKTGNSFLCTTQTYGDFILEFEYMGHPTLNSGVQFRSQIRERDDRVFGYQCELEDENKDRDWHGGIYDEARRGWIFPMKGDDAAGEAFGEQGKRLWKNGEWNTIRIECRGTHIQTFLNGEKRADLEDKMDAEGLIGLQVHGVGDREEPMSVKWRNIRIQVLD